LTYKRYVVNEHKTLRATGTNVAKHSYLITGLSPFNPTCTNWTGAIETLGQRTLTENKDCEKLKGWESRVQDPDNNEDTFVELTTAQAALLMEGFTPIYGELKRDLPIIACLCAKAILAHTGETQN
jgi:hypothetical protein